jgi:chromodomain-helicase-DNA-binding protein 7
LRILPQQNDVKEFWTLLNFIDPDNYNDLEEFLESYGDIKSKEKIDELHETIRPYILRRLKEDVEKSVPPKEETLIEVELTLAQKQVWNRVSLKYTTQELLPNFSVSNFRTVLPCPV